jgi:hypothetical protein
MADDEICASTNMTQALGNNRAAEKAVSAYEKKLFGKNQSLENVQRNVANDIVLGSLRYIFTVFQ